MATAITAIAIAVAYPNHDGAQPTYGIVTSSGAVAVYTAASSQWKVLQMVTS